MHEIIYFNPCYTVVFISGSSGNFLKSIIRLFLTDNNLILSHFPNGNAHTNLLSEFDILVKHEYPHLFDNHEPKPDPNQTLFVHATHDVPNWDSIFQYFPNLTILLITLDKRSFKRQILNFAVKVKMIPSTNIDYLKNLIDNIDETHHVGYPFDTNHILPDHKNIIKIPFYEIVHERDKVLNTISQLTKKPIKDNIIKSYDNYLKSQYDLFPWFNDKTND